MYKLSKSDKTLLEHSRGNYSPELKWYAVMTLIGREHRVRDGVMLELAPQPVAESLLPEVPGSSERSSDTPRMDLLFPSYLFIRCVMSDPIYERVAALEGVVKILGRAWRIPSILDDQEIFHLKGILRAPLCPRMISRSCLGDQAEVTSGILRGLRGNILEVAATQVKLETHFSFLNNDTGIVIVVPRSDVALVPSQFAQPSNVARLD